MLLMVISKRQVLPSWLSDSCGGDVGGRRRMSELPVHAPEQGDTAEFEHIDGIFGVMTSTVSLCLDVSLQYAPVFTTFAVRGDGDGLLEVTCGE